LPALFDEPVPVQLVVGAQWGDEGKGKIVDLLGESCDLVARYQGGPNAGHTVRFGGDVFILHQVPSGMLRPHARCIMGNGVVIHPESLLDEIAMLEAKGLDVYPRLGISPSAHLILPYHRLLDQAMEDDTGTEKIGTTGRGIGPAYADKASRTGLRIGMLLDDGGWEAKVRQAVRSKNTILAKLYDNPGVDEDAVVASLRFFQSKIRGCITDTGRELRDARGSGKHILIEGAQGTLLDIDFGTYPFVTSSNTTAGGACTGLGLNPKQIDRVVGIVKAYTTRVGNGPFPTECLDATGETLRSVGGEYGATTGRPRRCGWFDAVVVRYAAAINGIDALAMMKLDVLDAFDEIRVCNGYQLRGAEFEGFPSLCHESEALTPVYETFPGWKTPVGGVRAYRDLPANARAYVEAVERRVGIPVRVISVGAERDATIWK
jgi:adenylosuccinate synthase